MARTSVCGLDGVWMSRFGRIHSGSKKGSSVGLSIVETRVKNSGSKTPTLRRDMSGQRVGSRERWSLLNPFR